MAVSIGTSTLRGCLKSLNREIAAELGITERTVKVHRGRAMEKLGVQSTTQLFPMVLHYIACSAWPKFRRHRRKPKKATACDRCRIPESMIADTHRKRVLWHFKKPIFTRLPLRA